MPNSNHIGDVCVNPLVTDKHHRIGDNHSMEQKPYLLTLLDAQGMSQSEFGRRLGTSKQQVNKLVHDERRLSPEWARRIGPIVGMAWSELIDAHARHQSSSGVKNGIAVREVDPPRSETTDDPDEIALLDGWRKLTITKRAALFAYLGIDEMPSLQKPA